MSNPLTVGWLIKRYIKLRGRTAKDVAAELKYPYTTFCGILNRDVVDANLLLRLANLLDMDLSWMAELFDGRKPISSLSPYQMSRMQRDFREQNLDSVRNQLDDCIRNNPSSISEARKELISIYHNVFYLLDMLLPEEYVIRITLERGKEKFYCIPLSNTSPLTSGRGRSTNHFYEGNEMLNQIIAHRKEELL